MFIDIPKYDLIHVPMRAIEDVQVNHTHLHRKRVPYQCGGYTFTWGKVAYDRCNGDLINNYPRKVKVTIK